VGARVTSIGLRQPQRVPHELMGEPAGRKGAPVADCFADRKTPTVKSMPDGAVSTPDCDVGVSDAKLRLLRR
jgi:hypothetical protein